MSERRRYIVVVTTLCIVLICAFFALKRWVNPGFTPVRFNQAEWKHSNAETRGHMVEDLLSTHSLVGSSKDQVIDLLGTPDEDQKHLRRFRYYLGRMGRNPDAPFLTDYSLLLRFDNDEVVIDANIAD